MFELFSFREMTIGSSRLSVSNDLKYDAQRDLYDIGAQFIEVHPLNKVLDEDTCLNYPNHSCFI